MSQLVSIRMRASSDKMHVSGAERIIQEDHIESILTEMMLRAVTSCIKPDEIIISIEAMDHGSAMYCNSLDVKTRISSSCRESRSHAKEILQSNGISPLVIETAFLILQSGPTPERTNMRGAVIMDAITGKRLEPDIRRGIRVSRIDYSVSARTSLEKKLLACRIHHDRVLDGIAIAAKVAAREETIAELCWSDHPDYTTGYVASKQDGYVRITSMKEKGSFRGGRVFFVNPGGLDLDQYIHYLEKQPLIIDRIGEVYPPEELCSSSGR